MAIYVKYTTPDIKGSVTATGFEDQFEVTSFQWGVGRSIGSATGSSGNREATAASVSEITLTKSLDNASAELVKQSLSGKGTGTAVISFTRTESGGGNVAYLVYTLSDVIISGYSVSSGGDRPQETVSLNFVKIEIKDTPMGKDGKPGTPVSVTYDLGATKLT